PLLFRLLESVPRFKCIVALMQREVAERLTARPGSKAYGTLSVMLAYHATRLETVATVSPNVFVPRPEVASAVVRIDLRPELDLALAAELSAVVRAAFGHRRKTLRRALAESGRWSTAQIEAALAASRIDPTRRGESLDLDAFWALTEAFRRAEG
ncbi:MAG TPA: rRNA adenine dimethyltransferase family protein, partial [Limnochordia bacterium]|nr:rRNA adenine dimethyltransferase family protein [Limnochordia bacterium]